MCLKHLLSRVRSRFPKIAGVCPFPMIFVSSRYLSSIMVDLIVDRCLGFADIDDLLELT